MSLRFLSSSSRRPMTQQGRSYQMKVSWFFLRKGSKDVQEGSSDDTLSLDLELDLKMIKEKKERKKSKKAEEHIWHFDKVTGKVDAHFAITQ